MSFKADATVIMPLYNGKDYITKSFSSVKNQSFKGNIELLVINDGSTDNSLDVALRLKKELDSPNFKVNLHSQGNKGIAPTKYAASKMASADVVFMLDQDDALTFPAVESMLNAFRKHPDASIVYSDHDVVNPQGQVTLHSYKRQFDLIDFLTGFPLKHLRAYVKKPLVEHYPDALSYKVAEDFAVTSSMVFAGHKFVHVPQVNYLYLVNGHNVTLSTSGLETQYREAKDIIRKHFAQYGVDNVLFQEPPVRPPAPDAFTHYLSRTAAVSMLKHAKVAAPAPARTGTYDY